MQDHDQTHPGRSGGGRSGPAMTRRTVVAGSGLLAATAALAACSSYGSGEGGAPAAPGDGSPGGAYPDAQQPPSPGAEALADKAEIPVGGGVIFPEQEVVVTQPAPDEFRAFSAVCTHQQCLVNKVEAGTIDCPCHGSKFAVADGTPVDGPAKKPLPPREVRVEGTSVRVV
jgi:Rieske Fe-S protein